MTWGVTFDGPHRAALRQRLGYKLMDIFLHVGAHRTATTSFQHYLQANVGPIETLGVRVWGPSRFVTVCFQVFFQSIVQPQTPFW